MTKNFLHPLKLAPVHEVAAWAGSLLPEHVVAATGAPAPAGTAVRWGLFCTSTGSNQVVNGSAAGSSLAEFFHAAPEALVGSRYRPGQPFPLYVRLIDAGQPQPLQVHAAVELPGLGTRFLENNKLWHVVASQPGAQIGVGFASSHSRYRFTDKKDGLHFENLVKQFPANPHDSFYIPAGRLHNLNGGTLIWEIGQVPATPLRIADLSSGIDVPREEHEAAVKQINFLDHQIARISNEASSSLRTRRIRILPYCPHFFVDEIRLYDRLYDKTDPAVFSALIILEGTMEIRAHETTETFHAGDVCLLPAGLGDYGMFSQGGEVRMLQVTPNVFTK
jgi:mannose-6-phosphate isomerase